jgi:hypothetical protein
MKNFTEETNPATVKPEPTTTWQDCIVEELTNEAQAAVSGGGVRGTLHYNTGSPEDRFLASISF